MNITQSEQSALFTSKLIEGKDEDTARNEIMRDLKFIKEFNTKKRELERIIKALEREITKRIKKIERLKLEAQKRLQQDIRPEHSYVGSNHSSLATTNIIKRVLHYLESNHKQADFHLSKQIANYCCISHSQSLDALKFIGRYIK